MTIAWGKKPDPEPAEALSPIVHGPGGTVFHDCTTVAGVDVHIRRLMGQLVAHRAYPKRIEAHWQDVDALLERRHLLTLESWLGPTEIPL